MSQNRCPSSACPRTAVPVPHVPEPRVPSPAICILLISKIALFQIRQETGATLPVDRQIAACRMSIRGNPPGGGRDHAMMVVWALASKVDIGTGRVTGSFRLSVGSDRVFCKNG